MGLLSLEPLSDLVFLDLLMPFKKGFECLAGIRQSQILYNIPLVILSTAKKEDVVHKIYIDEKHSFCCGFCQIAPCLAGLPLSNIAVLRVGAMVPKNKGRLGTF